MGNGFAYLVLALWPLLAIHWYKKKSIQTATLWTILGGFMFLPVKTEVDLPMIPALGKHTIPVVSALIGCWFIKNQHISYIKELGKIKYLVILLIITPFITSTLNGDVLIIGDRFIKGLTYYDGLSAMINQFLLITPFFIGRQFFKTYDDHLLMFKLLVVAGLLYSLLMLFEIRMSPQLHTWIYGYFPHSSFGQQIRDGGFRPVVFMGHGLLVSFFTFVVLFSAIILWNNRIKTRTIPPSVASCCLFVVLVLCKSVASLLYGLFAFTILKVVKPKAQYKVAIILVCLAMFYPAMSIMNVFPHQAISNIATSYDKERAQSLIFRFDNEQRLLNHGRERFFFGWGGWGRNRVYSEETGRDISVTDGGWIITFGQFGLFGFIAVYGLLGFVVFQAAKASRFVVVENEQKLLSAHAVLVGIIMVNQLPNNALAPWLWLLVGVLFGRTETIISHRKTHLEERRKSLK